jgi:hypothetical protein
MPQAPSRAYVFGTGPSLARAIARDFSDGYRIVCNTIVRDRSLWQHLDPHFIVAGDALYHFSAEPFAVAFRRDLAHRLAESHTTFVYPQRFDAFVRRELAGQFDDRLIPIRMGRSRNIHNVIEQQFKLPDMGNALNLLLLPLACALSRDIGLWGFDGRAPSDQLFWSNSRQHSYPEHLPGLKAAFPAFFSHNVPAGDEQKYARKVHGEPLERALSRAERAGWRFEMLHPSWTETLQRRYRGHLQPQDWAINPETPPATTARNPNGHCR